MNFDENVFVLARIPKTASVSITDCLQSAIGEERSMGLRIQKIENVRSSRLAELGVLAYVEARKLVAATMGKHYLVPRDCLGIDLRQIAFFHGHFCIGQEPRTGRKPIYLTVVREPVDRFLSYFYYRLDQLATMKRENRLGGSHPMIDQLGRPPASPMEFLELLLAQWRPKLARFTSEIFL